MHEGWGKETLAQIEKLDIKQREQQINYISSEVAQSRSKQTKDMLK